MSWQDRLKEKAENLFWQMGSDTKKKYIRLEDVELFISELLKEQREIIAKMSEKDIDNFWFANRIRNYSPEPTGGIERVKQSMK